MAELPRGANAALPTPRVHATVSCAVPVDVSALLVGSDLRVRSDDDLVFYNAPQQPGVRWSESGTGQRIDVDCDLVPADAHAVLIAVSMTGAVSFGSVPPPQLQLTADNGGSLVFFTVTGLGPEKAIIGLELYRRGTGWKVRAVGQGYAGGLAELVIAHGIVVDDPGAGMGAAPAGPAVGAGAAGRPGPADEAHQPRPAGANEVGYVTRSWLIWEDASRSVAAFRSSTEHALNLRNEEVAGRAPQGRYQELMRAATDRLAADAAHLSTELAECEAQAPPELTPFNGPAWLTWQPPDGLAEGVLLGSLSVAEAQDLRIPLVLPMPWRCGVWISSGPVPGLPVAYAWSLVTRFLAASPPGLVGIDVIDGSGLSGAGWLHGYDPAVVQGLLGGGVSTGPSLGERLGRLLDLVDLRRIGTPDDAAAALPAGPPIRLVVVLDVGAVLDGEHAHQLLRLAEDGPSAGVPVLLVETDSSTADSVRALRIRQTCNSLPGGDGVVGDSWVGGEWNFSPDLLPDAADGTHAPSLFSHVLGAHARAIAAHD